MRRRRRGGGGGSKATWKKAVPLIFTSRCNSLLSAQLEE
jgi:hypothetical protein